MAKKKKLWCPDCQGSGWEESTWDETGGAPEERLCASCAGKGRVAAATTIVACEADLREWFEDKETRPIGYWVGGSMAAQWPEPVGVERVAFLGTEAERGTSTPWWGAKYCLVFHLRCVDGAEFDFTYLPEMVGPHGAPAPCSDRTHRPTDWPDVLEPPKPSAKVHRGPQARCGCDFAHQWDEERWVDVSGATHYQIVYAIGPYHPCEHGLYALTADPKTPHCHMSIEAIH